MSNENKEKDGRYLKISNFRNIGVTEKEQIICLNRSTKEEYLGNLVILIGPNNSGKTNILDAISILNPKKNIEESDLPYVIRNENEKTYIKYFDYKGNEYEKEFNNILSELPKDFINLENKLKEIFQDYKGNFSPNYINGVDTRKYINNFLNELKLNEELFSKNKLVNFLNDISNLKYWTGIDGWSIFSGVDFSNKEINSFLEKYKNLYNSYFEDKQVNNIPKVIYYQDWKINNSFFKVSYNEEWNPLMKNILNQIKVGIQNDLKNGINGTKRYYQDKAEKIINKINSDFNELFKEKGYSYDFSLSFEESSIRLEINLMKENKDIPYGENVIPLLYDEQSIGFKYFFNLYFNLLFNKDNGLKAGDIILMDEPASNLHTEGIIEFRKILKDFCMKTGISIIMSTHSPFFVNPDFFDELRIVQRINGTPDINNNFQNDYNDKPSNSLESVIKPLRSPLSTIINYPNPYFIFVEGITDYNYLTGFKVYLLENKETDNKLKEHLEQMVFIPINGLGKDKEQKDYIKKLINTYYKERKYIFLTDSDKAGEEFKKDYEDKIIGITSLINKKKEIEDLISNDDKTEFNIKKDSNNSATFKYAIIKDKISEETKIDFKELFEKLIKKLFPN